MRFEYDCPHCDAGLTKEGFTGNVYCKVCDKSYEVDSDYFGDNMDSWLTGVEYDGEVDID